MGTISQILKFLNRQNEITIVEIDSTFEWVLNSEISEISEEHYKTQII